VSVSLLIDGRNCISSNVPNKNNRGSFLRALLVVVVVVLVRCSGADCNEIGIDCGAGAGAGAGAVGHGWAIGDSSSRRFALRFWTLCQGYLQ
jgi:hypothetical protein